MEPKMRSMGARQWTPELTVTGYFTVLLVGPRLIPIASARRSDKETGFYFSNAA